MHNNLNSHFISLLLLILSIIYVILKTTLVYDCKIYKIIYLFFHLEYLGSQENMIKIFNYFSFYSFLPTIKQFDHE